MPDPTRLTRVQMEDVIRRGGSVMLQDGKKVTAVSRLEDLPDDATLAGDDPDTRSSTLDELMVRREALDAQIERLKESSPEVPEKEEKEEKPEKEEK